MGKRAHRVGERRTKLAMLLSQFDNLFSLRCCECDSAMLPTPSGYLACPRGCGKLVADTVVAVADDEPSLFDVGEADHAERVV